MLTELALSLHETIGIQCGPFSLVPSLRPSCWEEPAGLRATRLGKRGFALHLHILACSTPITYGSVSHLISQLLARRAEQFCCWQDAWLGFPPVRAAGFTEGGLPQQIFHTPAQAAISGCFWHIKQLQQDLSGSASIKHDDATPEGAV